MIKLKNGYKVIADDTCYKLVRERTEVTIGYYSELNKALDAFVKETIREKVKDSDATITEVSRAIKELREYVKKEVGA